MASPERRKGGTLTKNQKKSIKALGWMLGTAGFGLILWHWSAQAFAGAVLVFFAASFLAWANEP